MNKMTSANTKIPREAITPELLAAFIEYIPETGDFFWKEVNNELQDHLKNEYGFKKKLGGKPGSPAFTSVNKTHGFKQTGFGGTVILANRAAIALTKGYWPHEVETVNDDKLDMRLSNLSEIMSRSRSRKNLGPRKNASPFGPNITRSKRSKSYYLQVRCNGKYIRMSLGRDLEQAQKLRDQILLELGFTDKHNKPQK